VKTAPEATNPTAAAVKQSGEDAGRLSRLIPAAGAGLDNGGAAGAEGKADAHLALAKGDLICEQAIGAEDRKSECKARRRRGRSASRTGAERPGAAISWGMLSM